MAYDTELADRIRKYLVNISNLEIEEKEMFSGLTFMINGKMCINVSGENLMCRFDPILHEEITHKKGFEAMIMKGKRYKGYCYIRPEGFETRKDFEYYLQLCLDFNKRAKSSKKKQGVLTNINHSI